jgi:hypothetical protein
VEPPSGADPDHPRYEGGAATVRGGMASGAGVEPTGAWFRAMLGCRQPTRNRYAGRDLNPQTTRFELAGDSWSGHRDSNPVYRLPEAGR